MDGNFGSLIFFGFLAAVIIVPQVLKSNDRRRMYDTLRTAYERGQPVPPELLDAMTRRGRVADDVADAYSAHLRPAVDRDLRRWAWASCWWARPSTPGSTTWAAPPRPSRASRPWERCPAA